MWSHHSICNGAFLGHGFMWIIWAVLLAFVVYFAVGSFNKKPSVVNSTGKPDALALLQERFAKGEIGKEEYQERKSILEM